MTAWAGGSWVPNTHWPLQLSEGTEILAFPAQLDSTPLEAEKGGLPCLGEVGHSFGNCSSCGNL